MKSHAIKLLTVLLCAASLSTTCASTEGVIKKEATVIRFGEGNVPNYIKGHNLTSELDFDPAFSKLKETDQFGDIAFAYLDHQSQLLKLVSPRKEFKIKNVKVERLGFKHVKLQQTFNKIPVWAKEIIIHLNERNEVYLFQGKYVPLSPALNSAPRITAGKAKTIALAKRPWDGRCKVLDVKQYIWAPDASVQRLAYRLTLLKSGIKREYMFVDAINGQVLQTLSGTPSVQTSINK